jgi:hypothetical protein
MEPGHRGPKQARTCRRPKGPLQFAKEGQWPERGWKGTITLAFDYAREEEDDNGKGL